MKRFLIFVCTLFMYMSAHAVTFNFQHNGTTKQIVMDTEQRTHPAFATKIGDTVYYASMVRTNATTSGEMFAQINDRVYHIIGELPESKFIVTTTPNTNSFSFDMSAKGTFYVDWGDGTVDEIVRADTNNTQYAHTYATAGTYSIKFSGQAVEYSTKKEIAAISFVNNTNISKIGGSLGAIFSSIGDGGDRNQPQFYRTFSDCTNLTGTIPENLFAGISGAPVQSMFGSTFEHCSNLTGGIPQNLFAGLSGAPMQNMFAWTFSGCSKLTGEIPVNLFGNISGTPAEGMFGGTFYYASGLQGTIPVGLFGNLYGAPAKLMFNWTFEGCKSLTGATARMPDGTRLYDVMYNGETWIDLDKKQSSYAYKYFHNMYTNSGITTSN